MNPAILLLAVLGGQPQPLDGPTRDDLVAEALERFGEHDHQGAIAAFERAYALEHRAVDLYNIGRIYEHEGEPQRAREYYRRFLSDPKLSPGERKEGKDRLAALPAPPPPVAPSPVAPPPITEAVAEPAVETTSALQRTPRHWTVITGATLLPVGAVALLSGGVVATSALSHARGARQAADDQTPVDATPQFAVARRQALASDVLLGLGGTMAATGIAMLTVGLVRQRRAREDRQEQPRVAVAPLGAGLRLDVRF